MLLRLVVVDSQRADINEDSPPNVAGIWRAELGGSYNDVSKLASVVQPRYVYLIERLFQCVI